MNNVSEVADQVTGVDTGCRALNDSVETKPDTGPNDQRPVISIITPVLNAAQWLDPCFESLLAQSVFLRPRRRKRRRRKHHRGAKRGRQCARRIQQASGKKVQRQPGRRKEDKKRARTRIFRRRGEVRQRIRPCDVEVSIYDDGSTDGSWDVILRWADVFRNAGLRVQCSSRHQDLGGKESDPLHGCGHAKNRCVLQSSGQYLCFLDADDVMTRDRLQEQFNLILRCPNPYTIVGANFYRNDKSTPRYTTWLNSLSDEQLLHHQFREVPLIQPTWFLPRLLYDRVGGYSDVFGDPEDLMFIYRHIEMGGALRKVHKPLLMYRYHEGQLCWRVKRKTLFRAKVAHFEAHVLNGSQFSDRWTNFSIWGSGRDGKGFFKCLTPESKRRVTAFWDIDKNKIGNDYVDAPTGHRVPVRHIKDVVGPVALCVALDRGNGFEEKLRAAVARTGMQEGIDYFHCV